MIVTPWLSYFVWVEGDCRTSELCLLIWGVQNFALLEVDCFFFMVINLSICSATSWRHFWVPKSPVGCPLADRMHLVKLRVWQPQSSTCKAENGVASTDAAAGVVGCQMGFPGNCPTTSRDEEDIEWLVLDLWMGEIQAYLVGMNSHLPPLLMFTRGCHGFDPEPLRITWALGKVFVMTFYFPWFSNILHDEETSWL